MIEFAKAWSRTLSGLHNKRQLGVDAVGILLALLNGGHFVGLALFDLRFVGWWLSAEEINQKFVDFGVLAVAKWAGQRGRAAEGSTNESAPSLCASPKAPGFRRKHHADDRRSCFEIKVVG